MADEVVKTSETTVEQPDNGNRLPRTQEEFDAVIQGRHDRDMKKFADYGELKAKVAEYEKLKQAAMTDAEKKDARLKELETQNADLTSQLTDREAKVLRVQTLEAAGLPTSWAERVHGTTAEEIKADVGELTKLLGVKKQSVGGPGAPADTTQPVDINASIRRMLGY